MQQLFSFIGEEMESSEIKPPDFEQLMGIKSSIKDMRDLRRDLRSTKMDSMTLYKLGLLFGILGILLWVSIGIFPIDVYVSNTNIVFLAVPIILGLGIICISLAGLKSMKK